MSLLRREPTRTEPATAPVPHEDDAPDRHYFKTRARRLRAQGVKSIGPDGPPAPLPEPPAFIFGAEHGAHAGVVEREIADCDAHAGTIEARIAAAGEGTFAAQELRRELSAVRSLRADLVRDLRPDWPGAAATDALREFIAIRARELREQSWHSAERAAAEGDHRRARMLRYDALRSRQIAEREAGLRPHLSGY